MRAVVLNCTLKKSPQPSNTDTLARVVIEGLVQRGVAVRTFRVVDHNVLPGVVTNAGEGDE